MGTVGAVGHSARPRRHGSSFLTSLAVGVRASPNNWPVSSGKALLLSCTREVRPLRLVPSSRRSRDGGTPFARRRFGRRGLRSGRDGEARRIRADGVYRRRPTIRRPGKRV